MAISYISTASAATNTVAMPSHAAGDLIVAFAFRDGSTTAPTVPGGWRSVTGGANTCSFACATKIAASGSETTGTWTNATGISIAVYRKASTETWTTPVITYNTGSSTTLDYTSTFYFGPNTVIPEANTELWYVRFAGHRSATDLTTNTPSGWTPRGGTTTETRIIDSGASSTLLDDAVGDETQTVNGNSGWFTACVRMEVWNGGGMVCMGSDAGPNDASFIMPFHSAGDLIVGYACRTASATPPSLPAGYTDLSNGGANTFSSRLAYKVATSSSESVPTFTNATFQIVSIYRNPLSRWDTIDVAVTNDGNSTTLDHTQTYVQPVPNQTTGFLRLESANTAYGFLVTGWDLRSYWAASPTVAIRDALNVVKDAASIGSDTLTITSSAWRTNTIRIAYDPYRMENFNLTDAIVPSNVTGCWVTLIGGGGGGSGGRTGGLGGAGGGGGARIDRVFVPAASLGGTFTVATGIAGPAGPVGANGTAGGSSSFTSGSVTLTAGGGGGGGQTSSVGSAGTASASGVSATTLNGTAGGAGGAGAAGSAASNNSNGAGAGGGGAAGNNFGQNVNGAKGGDSATISGGTAGVAGNGGSASNAAAGNGGAGGGGAGVGFSSAGTGGAAGAYGGGGGGGGGASSARGTGGIGGVGYTLVEWVPSGNTQFFTANEFF